MMDFTEEIRNRNAGADSPALAFVDVYGCQQNEADGERLRGMLLEMGYGMTGDPEAADVVIINTCAVRDHAEKRVLGHVGAMKRAGKPGRILAVCGCMAQQEAVQEKIKRSYPQVGLMFGPALLPRLPEMLYEALTRKKRLFYLSGPTAPIEEELPVLRGAPPRAWVTVMTGCDNYCSYCIVPYVRGRERSREPEHIVREVKELATHGYSEIFLLGQNVNSYRPSSGSVPDFPALLEALNEVEGDFSIRFITSHPKDATPRLFDTMAKCGKVAKFLHLPLQSGSDRVLSMMNRRYTTESYISLVEYARAAMPGLNLTSDIIVGFPGETEEDFAETLKVVRQIGFNSLFTFIYSPRPGSSAFELSDETPAEVKKQRFQRLLSLQKEVENNNIL